MDFTTIASYGVNQLLLVLVPFTMFTGVADLSSVALCFTQVLPFDVAMALAAVLGCGAGFVFLGGQLVNGVDFVVRWRAGKRAQIGSLEGQGRRQDKGTKKQTETGKGTQAGEGIFR